MIHYAPIALQDPKNYEARSNIMWASSLALNHILTIGIGGAWACHPIEHELSAYYDLTHGQGLAIITPAWMKYFLNSQTEKRFARYAEKVWGIQKKDIREQAKA